MHSVFEFEFSKGQSEFLITKLLRISGKKQMSENNSETTPFSFFYLLWKLIFFCMFF